jgi:hypothetical protein
MLFYWYNVVRILLMRSVKKRLDVNRPFIKTFRVKAFDCDALRVMAAYKYSFMGNCFSNECKLTQREARYNTML